MSERASGKGAVDGIGAGKGTSSPGLENCEGFGEGRATGGSHGLVHPGVSGGRGDSSGFGCGESNCGALDNTGVDHDYFEHGNTTDFYAHVRRV